MSEFQGKSVFQFAVIIFISLNWFAAECEALERKRVSKRMFWFPSRVDDVSDEGYERKGQVERWMPWWQMASRCPRVYKKITPAPLPMPFSINHLFQRPLLLLHLFCPNNSFYHDLGKQVLFERIKTRKKKNSPTISLSRRDPRIMYPHRFTQSNS